MLGRELELQDVLGHIKTESIENVVFLTSDVHFTAAVKYDPSRATFQDFDVFYEFVIGPVHAGAFGPQILDASFGPEYEYVRAPGTEGLGINLPPPNLQSFGHAMVSEDGSVMTVKLIDVTGEVLFEKVMEASTTDGENPAPTPAPVPTPGPATTSGAVLASIWMTALTTAASLAL